MLHLILHVLQIYMCHRISILCVSTICHTLYDIHIAGLIDKNQINYIYIHIFALYVLNIANCYMLDII